MTEELKPCPAGHDAEIVQHPDGITYAPKCADWNCAWGIDEEFSDPETAAKFWNTRAESAEVARLKERIAELEVARQWMPIESAPKDHVRLLGHAENVVKFMFFDRGRWYEHNNGDYHDGGHGKPYLIHPTHWMPLPKGPEES